MCNLPECAGIWHIFSTKPVFPRINIVFYSMSLGLCVSEMFFSAPGNVITYSSHFPPSLNGSCVIQVLQIKITLNRRSHK